MAVDGGNQPFQILFHEILTDIDGANKRYHVPSHKPFRRVYESATYSKPFLGLSVL